MSIQSVMDSNFDKNITTSYFLSIQLTLDGFSFCVLDPISNEYIQFYHHPLSFNENIYDTLKKELTNNKLLGYPYQKVFVMYQTSVNTLIPSALFEKEKEQEFIDFCFRKDVNEPSSYFSNKIKMADSYCVYSMPQKTVSLLEEYYKNIYYFCQTTPFVEAALLYTANDSLRQHVHIDINRFHFDILVTSGNDLKLHNSFKYSDNKEFLYFALYVFEQLKLNTHSTQVFLTGMVTKNDKIYTLLKKYIKQVEISSESKHFKFSPVFKNIPLQNHMNLINIPLCV